MNRDKSSFFFWAVFVSVIACFCLFLVIFEMLSLKRQNPYIHNLEILANQQDPKAMYDLALEYESGLNIERNYGLMHFWLEKAASLGFSDAQNNLGIVYEEGKGQNKDIAKALYWYLKSAEQGKPQSLTNLGRLYFYARGVPQDYRKAFSYFEKAALLQHPDAENFLGVMYFNGLGVDEDMAKAVMWYKKANEKDNPEARFNLAQIYASPKSEVSNQLEAGKLFKLLEKSGSIPARQRLSQLRKACSLEFIKNKDPYYVSSCLVAAGSGDINAQSLLGLMYADGKGIKPDIVEAYVWRYICIHNQAMQDKDKQLVYETKILLAHQQSLMLVPEVDAALRKAKIYMEKYSF